LPSSISRRAGLLATTAFLLLSTREAAAQPRASTLVEAALFGAPPADRFGDLMLGAWSTDPPPSPPPKPALIRVSNPAPPQMARLAALAETDVMGRLMLIEAPPSRGPASPVQGSTPPTHNFPPPDKDSLLLLMVQLDELSLTDALAAYGRAEDPQLPVGELSRLLELDIDVSPAEGRITGRIGEARRALLIDMAENIARIGPVQVPLAPGDVVADPTEIYVRASVLMKLLPIRFEVDPRALQMKITALEKLPIQGRLQRLARIRQGPGGPQPTEVMRVHEPYRLATPPSFDVALDAGAQNDHPKAPFRYDVRMGGDLAFMGLEAYVGSDDEGRANTSRILLERRSFEGDLLGPLRARVVGLGDVFTPGLPIGPRSFGGRGVALSTVPLDQTTVFNRVDLRGDLPLGYDAELYVNDVLQGVQSQATRGQYEFLNVPLTQGINVVRIVTYGPRGERNEETRIINASGGLLRPGQATLEIGAVQQDESLIRLGHDPLAADPAFGKTRIIGNVSYGLTHFLTATAGGAIYTDRRGVERELGTVGLRTSVAGYALGADLTADKSGAGGGDVSIAGRVLGVNAVLRHVEYRGGLLDENNADADLERPLHRRTELTLDDPLTFGQRVIPLYLRTVRDDYVDGGSAWLTQARASAAMGKILYSTGLEYDRFTAVNGQLSDRLQGYFSGSTFRAYQWQLRGTVDYEAVPDLKLIDLIVTADKAISNRWSLRFGATQRLQAPTGLELIGGATTRTKFGDLSFTGDYDTNHNAWRLSVQLNFGIGYNPARRSYELTRQGPGSGGSAIVHAFVDTNGDGVFDAGDRPVAGVTVEGGDQQKVRTGPDGRAYVSGFGTAATARAVLGLSELDNLQVKAPPSVVEFTPRPGGVTTIEYPLRPTGEVMVNLKLRRPDGRTVGLSAARIRLVGAKGEVAEGVTEFDGGVNFHDVPAGTWRVELDPEQSQRLRMRLAAPVTVVIRPDGSMTPDANVVVEFEPRTGG
jgi:hypothetical protein